MNYPEILEGYRSGVIAATRIDVSRAVCVRMGRGGGGVMQDNDSSLPVSEINPVDQTSMYDPETGTGGNCWAACLATVTGLPLDEATEAIRAEDDHWWNDTVRFLKRNGWRIYHAFPTEKGTAPAGVSIMCGRSPREVSHATVAFDGVMVHDPHPSREGIDKPTAWFVLVPFVKVEAHDAA